VVSQRHSDPIREGVRAQCRTVEKQNAEAVLAQEPDRITARLDLSDGTHRCRLLGFDPHDRRHRQRCDDLVCRDQPSLLSHWLDLRLVSHLMQPAPSGDALQTDRGWQRKPNQHPEVAVNQQHDRQ